MVKLPGVENLRALIHDLGLPQFDPGPPYPRSLGTFPGGERYRIEIPEVETPAIFCEVLQTAGRLQLPLHRVSQGSGITLLSDCELREMARMGVQHGIEVFLFAGARSSYDVGAPAASERQTAVEHRLRGIEGLVHGLDEVFRAVDAGIEGILAADQGLIVLMDELRRQGKLPANLKIKSSVAVSAVNPAFCRLLERIGVNSLNVATDLTIGMVAAIRQTIQIPIDFYVESPPCYGGLARYQDLPELVRSASPIYLKFGLRNEMSTDPWGEHLTRAALAQARERVRRAALALEVLRRHETVTGDTGASDAIAAKVSMADH